MSIVVRRVHCCARTAHGGARLCNPGSAEKILESAHCIANSGEDEQHLVVYVRSERVARFLRIHLLNLIGRGAMFSELKSRTLLFVNNSGACIAVNFVVASPTSLIMSPDDVPTIFVDCFSDCPFVQDKALDLLDNGVDVTLIAPKQRDLPAWALRALVRASEDPVPMPLPPSPLA